MDGVACKLPGVISPPLNGAPEAATPPQIKPRISEGVQKLRLITEEKRWPTASPAAASPVSSRSRAHICGRNRDLL